MKTNVERVVDFLERFGIDEAVFEKKAGLSNAAISNNIKNKGKFSDRSLEKILTNYPEIRKEWLIMGSGPMTVNDLEEIKKPDMVSQAEYNKLIEENKKLKDEVLELSRRLLRFLSDK